MMRSNRQPQRGVGTGGPGHQEIAGVPGRWSRPRDLGRLRGASDAPSASVGAKDSRRPPGYVADRVLCTSGPSDPATLAPTRLTDTAIDERAAVWAPDASSIAYHTNDPDDPNGIVMHVMAPDGTDDRRVTDLAGHHSTPPGHATAPASRSPAHLTPLSATAHSTHPRAPATTTSDSSTLSTGLIRSG